jgi:hypothetical protein
MVLGLRILGCGLIRCAACNLEEVAVDRGYHDHDYILCCVVREH